MFLMGAYVDIETGEIIGYKVGGNCVYTAAVSVEKLQDLDVEDKEIVQYLDLEKFECVKSRQHNTYALVENELYYLEEFECSSYEQLGDKVALYGHVFNTNAICYMDSDYAINRIKTAENLGIESSESL